MAGKFENVNLSIRGKVYPAKVAVGEWPKEVNATSNCVGYLLAGGSCWIEPDVGAKILEDNFTKVDNSESLQAGQIVVLSADKLEFAHYTIVSEVRDDGYLLAGKVNGFPKTSEKLLSKSEANDAANVIYKLP